MKLSKLAIAAAFTTALIAAPAQARGHRSHRQSSPATEITQCGATISQPGNYRVSGTLDCSIPGPVLTIAASNVHLTISGRLSNQLDEPRTVGEGSGLGGVGNNLTIDGGGSVYGSYRAMGVQGDNITVANLTIGMNDIFGAEAFGIDGKNAVVKNCHIYGGGDVLDVGDNATVENNVISKGDTAKNAITVGANATVRGNTYQLDRPDSQGGSLFIIGPNGKITGNKNFGSIILSSVRIGVENSGASNNTVTHNTGIGLIWMETGVVNNTIQNNSAVEGRDDNGPPCVNQWKGNKLQTETGAVACIQ